MPHSIPAFTLNPFRAVRPRTWMLVIVVLLHSRSLAEDGAAREEFFETHVRPILVERCSECHGAASQEGGLRVDSRESLLRGGDRGAAITPGDTQSLLLKAVRHEGDLAMPPDATLSAREVRILEQWVKAGAAWPENVKPRLETKDAGKDHWAFQPVRLPELPTAPSPEWVRTSVDAFIAAKLESAGLSPSPPADRRTLIRRVTYDLTGLPPTSEEVARFVADPAPDAYERLVERLLASPHYGEHWARHWLDVARYSDTKGYVYAREERFWTHAWPYRDWVVRALNDDMPYDRFLLLQLAADQTPDRRTEDLAAMGFLTLGRRFLGVRRDVIDDRIDVVSRGTMGLTVACARCHDHKYDPIPTADYYSLYGVFDSCHEQLTVLEENPGDESFRDELAKRQETLRAKLTQYAAESSQRARERTADYLFAQSELHKFPADGFDQIFQKTDLLPAFVRTWESYLREAKQRRDPIFTLWHAYAELEPERFSAEATNVAARLKKAGSPVPPRIAAAFTTPPQSFREVCDRYGEVFAEIDRQWQARSAAGEGEPAPTSLADPDAEALRQVLYGEDAPCRVPEGPISYSETFFDSDSLTELWKMQGEVDRWLINAPSNVPAALLLVDRARPVEPRVFRRGNPLNLGEDVPRRFLTVLGGEARGPFQTGSGRLELAQAIIDPENPLTARVMVNRVWAHHFGAGLVTTSSDFGLRADPPSHPELLDWLAANFIREGWRIKDLHRWIVLSSTYRQRSNAEFGMRNSELTASDTTSSIPHSAIRNPHSIDPQNRLLWRMNPRRLTFEEVRDSLLAATDSLDRTMGGRPSNLFAEPFPRRRTLYGLVDRQYFPSALRMFDFANPDLHVPERSETTVPQQALFFMNHPLVLERAKTLAKLASGEGEPGDAVVRIFQKAYQREPSEAEIADALRFVELVSSEDAPRPSETAADWQYGYGAFDEKWQRVAGFTPLPHFTGKAWQGGPAWPDPKLGWVQLTAKGGHPGNDREHAAVRRWTAPRDMTISIRSHLVHEPAAGDGVRAFIVSSEHGLLESTTIHQKTADLNVEAVRIKQGATIDFAVDIGDVLNSDQHLWTASIEEGGGNSAWNSAADFPTAAAARLDAWELLAHVVLCANEFLFVD